MPTAIKQVRDLAMEQPSSVRVFERFGIDYCCGGRKSLAQVCQEQQIPLADLLQGLAEAAHATPQMADPWTTASLEDLATYIVTACHGPTRLELERLTTLAFKVHHRHGATHPELARIQSLVHQILEEMTPHMEKEERVLFPYIVGLERADQSGSPKPYACFGDVANPIAAMMAEHDIVGSALTEINILTSNYQLPDGACPTYHALYTTLAEFDALTRHHVELENSILFPRAIALSGKK